MFKSGTYVPLIFLYLILDHMRKTHVINNDSQIKVSIFALYGRFRMLPL